MLERDENLQGLGEGILLKPGASAALEGFV